MAGGEKSALLQQHGTTVAPLSSAAMSACCVRAIASATTALSRGEGVALPSTPAHCADPLPAQGVKANVLFFDRKPGSDKPWTKTVWVYDLRTNMHFTLKTKRMTRGDLDDFVACYKPDNRAKRKATWSEKKPEGRWRPYSLEDILARDKVSLDLFWLRDESLEDSANLPDPHVLAEEIADDLRSALEQIESVLGDLPDRTSTSAEAERS